jgi:spore germination protein GerM
MKRVLLVFFLLLASLACIVSPAATPQPSVQPPDDTVAPLSTDTVAAPGPVSVWVYFTMAGDDAMTPVPVARSVPASDDPATLLKAALDQLVLGPTDAEKSKGLTSWFSPATAGVVTLVSRQGGAFTVDFNSLATLIPNASTSAGSQLLLSQLNGTVFQFGEVDSVVYTLDGGCDTFWLWLQMDCHPVTRAE